MRFALLMKILIPLLAYFFFLLLSLSLFLFSFPFNVQGFQRFVESKFEPRFGNANSIEIFADSI